MYTTAEQFTPQMLADRGTESISLDTYGNGRYVSHVQTPTGEYVFTLEVFRRPTRDQVSRGKTAGYVKVQHLVSATTVVGIGTL